METNGAVGQLCRELDVALCLLVHRLQAALQVGGLGDEGLAAAVGEAVGIAVEIFRQPGLVVVDRVHVAVVHGDADELVGIGRVHVAQAHDALHAPSAPGARSLFHYHAAGVERLCARDVDVGGVCCHLLRLGLVNEFHFEANRPLLGFLAQHLVELSCRDVDGHGLLILPLQAVGQHRLAHQLPVPCADDGGARHHGLRLVGDGGIEDGVLVEVQQRGLGLGGKDLGSLCFACLDEAGSRLVIAISCVRSARMGKGGLSSYAQEECEKQCGVNAFSVHDLDKLMNIVIDLFGNGVLMLLGGRNKGFPSYGRRQLDLFACKGIVFSPTHEIMPR